MFSWKPIFHDFNDFLAILENIEAAQKFGYKFDCLCKKLKIEVDQSKKLFGYIINFLGIKFDTQKLKACLSKQNSEGSL